MREPRDKLPDKLRRPLLRFGDALEKGRSPLSEIPAVMAAFEETSPALASQADWPVADAARLHRRATPSLMASLFRIAPSDRVWVRKHPELAWVMLFHRDGFVREAALHQITEPPPSPFLLATLAWRLNDWVPEVRHAAEACARRTFDNIDPEVVARTTVVLMDRLQRWKRWTSEQEVLPNLYRRAEVMERVVAYIAQSRIGPVSSALRQLMRHDTLDSELPMLARQAVLPTVRAIALQALVTHKARWPIGYGRQWIDKPVGISRRVALFDERLLNTAESRERLIEAGLTDRSAAVRRVAADAVIEMGTGYPSIAAATARLISDKSASVRERGDFLQRHFT